MDIKADSLIAEVDTNPWGKGYQITTKTLGLTYMAQLSEQKMVEVAVKLFPKHSVIQ